MQEFYEKRFLCAETKPLIWMDFRTERAKPAVAVFCGQRAGAGQNKNAGRKQFFRQAFYNFTILHAGARSSVRTTSVPRHTRITLGFPVNSLLTPSGNSSVNVALSSGYFKPIRSTPSARSPEQKTETPPFLPAGKHSSPSVTAYRVTDSPSSLARTPR